jgi:hypothetical protein
LADAAQSGQDREVYLTREELQFIDYLVDMAVAAWKRS